MTRLEGRTFPTPVMIAGPAEPSLLGVVTLEDALLAVTQWASGSYPWMPTSSERTRPRGERLDCHSSPEQRNLEGW